MSRKRCHPMRIPVLLVILLAVAAVALSGCGDGALDLPRDEAGFGGESADAELHWLNALDIPVDELEGAGEIRQAWQLSENLVLLNQTQGQTNGFHLFHADSRKVLPIVSPTEHAVLEKVVGDKLFFVVKEVGENGDQEFPQRLVFDLATYKTAREKEAFIRRDVVFGGVDSPLLTLDGIYPRGDDVVLDFAYAKGETPTGIRPLTVADYSGRRLSLRIYNAAAREGTLPAAGEDSLVGRISCTELSPLFPPEQIPLFKGRYPYGAGWRGEIDYERPSIRVEISLREKASYHVRTVLRATGLVYVIEFKPDATDAVHGLSTSALTDLSPEEVVELYWRARQERSLGALRELLADNAEVGSLTEALTQTEREWQQGRLMVIAFSVGGAVVEDDRATVPVSYQQTGWDGRLIAREDVTFGLCRVDGVWKVDLSDHILALTQ